MYILTLGPKSSTTAFNSKDIAFSQIMYMESNLQDGPQCSIISTSQTGSLTFTEDVSLRTGVGGGG